MIKIKGFDIFYPIFYFIIISYGVIIVIYANFGVIDDHILLDTLLKGKNIPLFINPEIGRFYPLNGFEYNIIAKLSTSPHSFYLYNAFQFYVVIFLLYRISINVLGEKHKTWIVFIILILIFSPGFVTAWYRLFVPERNVFFFLVLFLNFFLKYQKQQKFLYLLISLISANIALYYKEPVFLMLGSFAFLHLIFGWKELNLKQKFLDCLLMTSSFIFIILYFLIVFINKGETLYGETNVPWIIAFAKNIFNYIMSDPMIIFILLTIIFWRLYNLILNREKTHILFDSLLFSSSLYIFVFFKLKIFSYHYLLPVYAFGIIAMLYYIEELLKEMKFKYLFFVTLMLIVLSSFLISLHLISHYKNVPNNFQATLNFISEYIKKNPKDDKKISIFLYNVDRNTGVEVYHSFIKYLEFKGLNQNTFDMKTNIEDTGVLKLSEIEDSPYTVFKKREASKIEAGDLVIITPYTLSYIGLDKKEITKMFTDYELIYHAKSLIEIPNLSIRSLIIYYFYKKYEMKLKDSKIIISGNIFKMPLDFYVLKKKG